MDPKLAPRGTAGIGRREHANRYIGANSFAHLDCNATADAHYATADRHHAANIDTRSSARDERTARVCDRA
jgi:hypothetical protein